MKDKTAHSAEVIALGQSGFRFHMRGATIYIDPYLSDGVEKIAGDLYRRQVPIWKAPGLVNDADWVLITHGHLDHCDLETILPISNASPTCHFVGPNEVCGYLERHGISSDRLARAPNAWLELAPGIRVHAVPAAHPEIETDRDGHWKCVGYVLEFNGRRMYHSGDTSLVSALIEFLDRLRPIDTAFLPVNEKNYFREQLGIVANMGLRDAFGFAQRLDVTKLVPMHWDMFLPNSVFQEEIELYYRLSKPQFDLIINPRAI